MVEHAERGKYCSPEHAKRAAAQLRVQSMGRTRTRTRTMATVHRRALNRARWREVAMGRDVQLHLDAIFARRQVARSWSLEQGTGTTAPIETIGAALSEWGLRSSA